MVWKEKKEFSADLKNIYNASTKEAANAQLDLFEKKWETKYPCYPFMEKQVGRINLLL